MIQRLCFSLFSAFAVSVCNAASINVSSGLGASDAGPSGHTLELRPPDSTAHDVEVDLANIAKTEHEKRKLSDTAFEAAKQRMIDVEKRAVA